MAGQHYDISSQLKCDEVTVNSVITKHTQRFLESVRNTLREFKQKQMMCLYRGSALTHRGPVDLRKWAIFNTILMSPKSWLSQEDLDASCEHSMVPVDS